MANEPFISVLIKGDVEQVNQIKNALISIKHDGEKYTNYQTLIPIPSNEDLLPDISLERAQELFGLNADLSESKERYWVLMNWGEYDENWIDTFDDRPGILWLQYRVRYRTPLAFYKNLSRMYPELFFMSQIMTSSEPPVRRMQGIMACCIPSI